MQDRESRPGWPGSFIQPNKDAGGRRSAQLISPKLTHTDTAPSRGQPGGGQSKKLPGVEHAAARAAPRPPPQKKQRTDDAVAQGSACAPSTEDRIAAAQLAAKPKQRTSSYVRPKQKEKQHNQRGGGQAQHGNAERLERAVVCGKLWYPECREASQDLPQDLPASFPSAAQYVKAYEPLIFEEAREALLHTRLDQYAAESPASVVSVEHLPSGWSEVKLVLERGSGMIKEGALAVISRQQLPPRTSVEWYADSAKQAGRAKRTSRSTKAGSPPAGDASGSAEQEPVLVAGVVRKAPPVGKSGEIIVGIHPRCPAHTTAANAPCSKVLGNLVPHRKLWMVVTSPMVTQQREFHALHKVPGMMVGQYMLHPEELADLGAAVEDEQRGQAPRIPRDCGDGLQQKLKAQFDDTQYRAIVAATRHLEAGPSNRSMPFVLVCGPPGTGKTHTVTGILNVWHLAHYTRHQNSIIDKLRTDFAHGDFPAATAGLEASVPGLAAKPKLLVCAPSNAAADELLQRVMTAGFVGNDGRVYFPNVVRVGAPGANIGEKARAVLVDGLVQALLDMSPQAWQHQVMQTEAAISHLSQNIAALQHHLGLLEVPDEAGSARDLALRQEVDLVRHLVERHDARSKQLLHQERLALIADHVNGRPGAQLSEVRDSIELLFVEDAEMVFTTLSSTGRKVFNRLPSGHFETVLIDEAAQASEVTTLQALTFGCRRVVLVGDPNQLPATVLSQKGRDLLFERSLFERLQQAGCPVHMLQVQYRMHPSIREFPSKHFYGDKLQDGPSVLSRPAEVFYENKLLKPYVFFDVSQGRDVVASGGNNAGSRRNQEEADLAVALFQVLREELIIAMERKQLKKPVVVGVITPYKEQVACIQDSLNYVLGRELASEVCVSTVDSYQGRQLDVIILSCVRANAGTSGVGFVADMRRMNVSITRAKRALWILGSAATLQQSPVWAALLDDARRRRLLIQKASARSLFPHLPQFRPDFESPTEGMRAPKAPKAAKQGPGMMDQQMQDDRTGGGSGQMLRELEAGCSGGIPGLGLDPGGVRTSSAQHHHSRRNRGGEARDESLIPEDADLYGDATAKPGSRNNSRACTPTRSGAPTPCQEPPGSMRDEATAAAPDFLARTFHEVGGFVPTEEVKLGGARTRPSARSETDAASRASPQIPVSVAEPRSAGALTQESSDERLTNRPSHGGGFTANELGEKCRFDSSEPCVGAREIPSGSLAAPTCSEDREGSRGGESRGRKRGKRSDGSKVEPFIVPPITANKFLKR